MNRVRGPSSLRLRADSRDTFIETKPTTEAGRASKAKRRRCSKHILYAVLGFSLLIITVVVSGVFYDKHNVKKQQKHDNGIPTQTFNDGSTADISANILVVLTKFDIVDGLSYFTEVTAQTQPEAAPGNGSELACALIYGSAAELPSYLAVKLEYVNFTGTETIFADGLSSRYPFDVYTTALYTNVFTYQMTGDQDTDCPDFASAPPLPVVQFIVNIQQALAGFSATVSPALDPQIPDFHVLVLTIKRDWSIIVFGVILYLVTWLLTLAMLIATIQAIAYHSEPRFDLVAASTALIFALPQVRSSMPGIPTTPTVADCVGFYWHIALLGLGTSALIVHSVWKLWVERYQQDRAEQMIGRRISLSPSDRYIHQTDTEEEVPMMKV